MPVRSGYGNAHWVSDKSVRLGQTLVCTVEGSEREAGRIRWAKIRLVRDFGFYFLNLGELLNIEGEYYGTTCRESA